MNKRDFGKTGEKLSIIGFGGIVVANETKKDVTDFVSKAIDRGINYFDVAPLYGNAQEMLGPALKPYRKDVFLACKTLQTTKKESLKDLHDSLKKLKTDYFDLYQLHGVTTLEDVDKIIAKNGALETFIEAKEKGLVRYLGFSAHSEKAAIALMENFDFTSMLFPLNWASWFKDNFGPLAIKKAQEKGMGILALKALAGRALEDNEKNKWEKEWYVPVETFEEASLGLRFTLSLPVTSAIPPGYAKFLWWACDIADNFKPLNDEEMNLLKEKSSNIKTLPF